MRIDLGQLHIDKVVVHDIPSRPVKGGGQSPRFSEIESPLDNPLRNYFREKIVSSLAAAAFDVEFDPGSESPVPKLVLDNLVPSTTEFVQMSVVSANHLYNSQTGANSPGLLCIAQSPVEGLPGMTFLKLEREAAVGPQGFEHRVDV